LQRNDIYGSIAARSARSLCVQNISRQWLLQSSEKQGHADAKVMKAHWQFSEKHQITSS
jgi:hypothetical protein